jgi:hypothetical protein
VTLVNLLSRIATLGIVTVDIGSYDEIIVVFRLTPSLCTVSSTPKRFFIITYPHRRVTSVRNSLHKEMRWAQNPQAKSGSSVNHFGVNTFSNFRPNLAIGGFTRQNP